MVVDVGVREPSTQEAYLGDGLYVSFDGYQLCLRTERDNGNHYIYLEPQVYDVLTQYAKRIWGRAE